MSETFFASATSSVFGFTNSGKKVTATASANATSTISYQDALSIAQTTSYNVATSELETNIDIIQQTISIIETENIGITGPTGPTGSQNNPDTYTQTSNILIVMDQLIAYHNLPSWLLQKLPGYQAFSKLGIEFTNIHNNRMMCSPSRASFQTSTINTGIQSNIDQPFQNFYIANLSYDAETIPKSIKKYNSEIVTAYYGKEHLSDQLAITNNVKPSFDINTTGAFKCYGFDRGSMFGDSYYKNGMGFVADNVYLNTILNNTTDNSDYIGIDSITNEKSGYVGVLPFLKARLQDNKAFHLQYHIVNPHDTQQFWQNFSQMPVNLQQQYFAPFLKEQTTDVSFNDPYFYNEFFPDAYVKSNNLTTNYFEQTFSEYSSSLDSLPFIESYVADYSISTKSNPINDYYVSMYASLTNAMTLATDQEDIKSWKNLINNYYGLIIEADKYVYKIYNFLKNNNMLKNVSVVMISDHGDLMSAHGLKQKGFPFKECVNVPCIIYSPKLDSSLQGSKNNVLGSLLDIAPTIDVLMDIRYKNTNFLGTTLVQENNGQIIPRTENLPVMNIFNDPMNGLSSFIDPSYNEGFFTFKYNFNMIIDYDDVDGKLYKYGLFFSIGGLFRYNFINNTLIPLLLTSIFSNILFTNLPFINNIDTEALTNLQSFMISTYPLGPFEFEDAYYKVQENFKSSNNLNSLELTLYILVITNYLKYYSNYEFIIPGVYNTFQDIITYDYPTWLEPFCYNITDDYNEVKNIFYKKNPDGTFSYDSSKEPLFSRLQEKLNDLTIKQCMTSPNSRFTFLIPEIIYQMVFLCFFKFGTDVQNYTKVQSDLLVFSLFLNTYDSRTSTQDGILKIINNLINS